VPERLNWLILGGTAGATAGCLWVASHAAWWVALPAAVAFALVNNTAFALMHEAVHGLAAATPRSNAALGHLASWMFPTSLSLQRTALCLPKTLSGLPSMHSGHGSAAHSRCPAPRRYRPRPCPA
jgi:hypothetical protein